MHAYDYANSPNKLLVIVEDQIRRQYMWKEQIFDNPINNWLETFTLMHV